MTYVNQIQRCAVERISEAEFEVMEILWREAPLTAVEVAERTEGQRGWSFATVKTLIFRLREKGILVHEEQGRRFLYRPAVAREAFVSQASRQLVDRMFGGKLTPLVAHFLKEERLTTEEIREIEELLKELKP
jgi:predicted transcriptional regulator